MTDKEIFLNLYNDIQNKTNKSDNMSKDQKKLFDFLTSDKTDEEWQELAQKRAKDSIIDTKEVIRDDFTLGAVLLMDYSLKNEIDENYEMKTVKTEFYISWLFFGLEDKVLHNIFAVKESDIEKAKENYNTLLNIINNHPIAEILDDMTKTITTS